MNGGRSICSIMHISALIWLFVHDPVVVAHVGLVVCLHLPPERSVIDSHVVSMSNDSSFVPFHPYLTLPC